MEMGTSQWFVECMNPATNESLARLLAEHSIGEENKYIGLLDRDGKAHDVWMVPSNLITRLREAKRDRSGNEHFKFRFWLRSGPDAVLNSAGFIEQKRTSGKMQTMKNDLSTFLTRVGKR